MKEYIRKHNEFLDTIDLHSLTQVEYNYHKLHIHNLQHERLIHLLVLMTTIAVLMTFFVLSFIFTNPFIYLALLILFVLTVFYIRHYYILENTLSKWYQAENIQYSSLYRIQ